VAEYTRRERANQESKNPPAYMTGSSTAGVVGNINAVSSMENPTASVDPVFTPGGSFTAAPARWVPRSLTPMVYSDPWTMNLSTVDRIEQRQREAQRAASMLGSYGPNGLALADSAERRAQFLQGLLNGTRTEDGMVVPDQLSATERAYYSGETRRSAEDAAAGYDSATPGRYPNWGGIGGPKGYWEQVAWLAKNAPSALSALAEEGMTVSDVANATEVFYAKRTSQTVAELLTMGLQYKAAQIVAILPPRQRILVSALLDEERKQYMDASRQAAERRGAAGTRSGTPDVVRGESPGAVAVPASPVEGEGESPIVAGFNFILDGLLWPLEQVTHLARAQNIGMRGLIDQTLTASEGISFADVVSDKGLSGLPEYLGALWSATAPGTLNPVRIEELREEYGDFATDLAVDYYLATQSEDENAMQNFLRRWESDPNAQAFINQMINGTDTGGDRTAASLYVQVAAADQGNWGNLFAQTFGLDADPDSDINNLIFSTVRDGQNVLSWFVFDPLVWGSKVTKAVQALRWGLNSRRFGGSVSAAIRGDKSVSRWYESFGQALKAVDDAREGANAKAMVDAQRRLNRFVKRESPFGTDKLASIGRKHNLYTAEQWARFYDDLEVAEKLANGRPVAFPRIDPTREGMEFLSQYTPQARRDAARAARAGRPDPVRVYDAAQAQDQQFAVAQGAKRVMMMPHMSWASESFGRLAGSILGTVAAPVRSASSRRIELLLDDIAPEWRTMSGDERADAVFTALGNEETANLIGYRLSDFTKMDQGGRRTLVARFLDRFVTGYNTREKTTAFLGTNRKGFRRKGWYFGRGDLTFSEAIAARLDRWSRLGAQLPDSRFGMPTADASGAATIYQIMRWGGVDSAAASLFRDFWMTAPEGARMVAYGGIVRSMLRATGMHLVAPEEEAKVLERVTGIASRELHAPISIARHGGVMQDISREANRIHAEQRAAAQAAQAAGQEIPLVESVATISRRLEKIARQPGGPLRTYVSPSMHNGGELSSAQYYGQTSDRAWMPNFPALDRYTARKSMLNMLLFNNNLSSLIVDAWVLGTLGGPRFQLRNGVEDVGLYALTGGTVGNFYRGRKVSQAVREATARDDQKMRAAVLDKKTAREEFDAEQIKFANGESSQRDLRRAEQKLTRASNVLAALEKRQVLGRNQKLGFVRTSFVRLSDRVSRDAVTGRVNDNMISRFSQWLVPTTSRQERLLAAEAGREAVADLQVTAILRNKLVLVNDPELRGIPIRLRRGASIEDLSARQQQAMSATERLLKSEYGTIYRDNAAETSRHLSDGTFPTVDDMGDFTLIEGEVYRRIFFDSAYTTERTGIGRLNEAQARAMMQHLQFIVGNGRLGQAALEKLPEFWLAYNAVGSSDNAAMRAIAEQVLNEAKRGREWPMFASRFRKMQTDGELKFVEDMLMDMAATFTTRRGAWNENLWTALRATDDKGAPYFRVWDDASERSVVHDMDFMDGTFEAPESILVFRGEPALLPATAGGYERFTNWAWETMGRSLARMTREPLWYGNYLDAAYQLEPLRLRYAKIFGESQADRMITDMAAERAYNLTMSYVDNPAVRSQLAWHVRNIARYYRAVEDFGRRLIRVGKNDPVAYWKATLAWQASQDFGFVHQDQYGNSYFMYPFTRAAITHLAAIGVDAKFAELPMAFGGNVQWISPSADPEQWIPTLSSPWAAVSLQPLIRSLPVFTEFLNLPEWAQVSEDTAKTIESNVFGDISADTTTESAYTGIGGQFASSLYSVLPANFKKLIALGGTIYGGQPPGTFGNKIAMKTFMMMAASGLAPTGEEWVDGTSAQKFLADLDRHTINVAALSLLFGLAAPSSPQYMDDNLTLAAREAAWESIVPALRDAIRSSTENGRTWEDAYISWVQGNPQSAAFVVTRRKGSEYGYIEPLSGNVEFLRENKDLWETSPVGVTMFAPNTGEESYKSYKAMQMFNAGQFKSLENFGTELVNVHGYQQYILNRSQFEQDTANMPKYLPDGSANPQYTVAEEAFAQAKRVLFEQFPGLEDRLNIGERNNRDNWNADADQIVQAATVLSQRGNAKAQEAMGLIQSYLDASADMSRVRSDPNASYSDESAPIKDAWENAVSVWMGDLQTIDRDTANTLAYTLTKALSTGWTLEEIGG
jgi:hypothetical protein